ncbi:hypothetical protein ACHWQZ_G018115 [Mnemiopsis leidyi]
MTSPRKAPDPTFLLRILSIINRMRNHKQRASIERIVYYMGMYYGLAECDVTKELNLAVNNGLVKKFIGIGGKESYRDSKYPNQIPSKTFVRKPSADLRMLVAAAIETIGSQTGSKIAAIEEHIRSNHALDLSLANLTSQLKLAVSHGVQDSLFIKNGPLININVQRLEELRQKDNQSYFVEGVEPSPVCGFCLGTSESNKEKHPEQLLSCVDCGNSGHPSCLKFSEELTRQCMSEPWQCIECKVCSFCQHSGDADNLLFCDSCDKGFHMDCLQPPMNEMPTGFWMCCLCDKVTDSQGKSARKRKKTIAPLLTKEKVNFKSEKPAVIASFETPTGKKKKCPKLSQLKEEVYASSDPMSDVKLIQGIMKAEEKKKKVKHKRNKVLNKGETEAEIKEDDPKTQRKKEETKVTDIDRSIFNKIIQKCNKALKISPVETAGQRSPQFIDFGEYEIETWYSSPLPFEYSKLSKLYFCEYCLKYMKSKEAMLRHQSKCFLRQPPANEIYRHKNISLFEVDGAKNKLYCRNLCLLAKMFLDHKTLYYDVEPFLFYVLTLNDNYGSHLVGYFSKEKNCVRNYNLSCIMTLPHTQRQGYGKLLIDFSYVLSKLEGKPGTPEKPLSDLGLISYRSYWRNKILSYVAGHMNDQILITDISKSTGILAEDLVLALHDLQILDYDEKCNDFCVKIDEQLLKKQIDRSTKSKHHIINEDALIWSPMVSPTFGTSSARRRKSTESSATSPRKGGMLLSPMKVVKSVDKVDPLSDVIKVEPRDIDTFTKYYPNWIPSGEDADEYRYAGEEMKGEIESFVMKKTPGRKKRVKFAVIYNPKSGKRVTKAIPQKKKTPEPKTPRRSSARRLPSQAKNEEPKIIEELLMVENSDSPAISYNEVSSSSDIKEATPEVKTSLNQDCEVPHSTTDDPEPPEPTNSPEVNVVSTPEKCVSNSSGSSDAGTASPESVSSDEKKRQHSSESESLYFPPNKKSKLETAFVYTDSDSEEEEIEKQVVETDQFEEWEEDDASLCAEPGEEESSSLFLNTFSNIYVKSPDCLKPSDSTVLSSKDS